MRLYKYQYPTDLCKDQAPLSVPLEMKDHPLFKEGGSVGLISGESPRYPSKIQGGHEALAKELDRMGLKYESTEGRYETPEKSYIVYGPTKQQMMDLGHNFGQESVIHSQNGRHTLIFTNGDRVGHEIPGLPGGEFFRDPPPDYFTRIPNRGYLRLHFNWEQPQELKMSEKVSNSDILAGLTKSIKGRIDKYMDELLKLRQESLVKSNFSFSRGNCPVCGHADQSDACTCLKKSSPPGREEQVEKIKGKLASQGVGKEKAAHIAFGTAWNQANKKAEPDPTQPTVKPKATSPGKCASCNKILTPVNRGMPIRHEIEGKEHCTNCASKILGKTDLREDKELPGTPVTTKKGEDFIDLNHASDPEKRLKNVGDEDGTLPHDKKSKKVGSIEGVGGKISKDEVPMAKPPSGTLPHKPVAPPSGNPHNKPVPQMQKAALPMRSAANAGSEAAHSAMLAAPGAKLPKLPKLQSKPPSAFENITPDPKAKPSGLELDTAPKSAAAKMPNLTPKVMGPKN